MTQELIDLRATILEGRFLVNLKSDDLLQKVNLSRFAVVGD